MFFDFSGSYDGFYLQNLGPDFVEALRQDRAQMLTADSFRSLIFVLISAGIILLFLRNRLTYNLSLLLFGIVILIDLFNIYIKYINYKDFIKPSNYATAITANEADKQIMQDSTYNRVLDLSVNPTTSARASYYHISIGAYHAAKPGRMQELFDFHIAEGNEQ